MHLKGISQIMISGLVAFFGGFAKLAICVVRACVRAVFFLDISFYCGERTIIGVDFLVVPFL